MRVPPWTVPLLVLLCAALGLAGARFLVRPSVVLDLAQAPSDADLRTTVLVVGGLFCVDTAERAAGQLDGLPGVFRFTAFASRNRAEVLYDPAVATVESIRKAIEGPIYDKKTGEFLFGLYRVVEADGVKYDVP